MSYTWFFTYLQKFFINIDSCLILLEICLSRNAKQMALIRSLKVETGFAIPVLLPCKYKANRLYLLHGNWALHRKSRVKPVNESGKLISATRPGFTTSEKISATDQCLPAWFYHQWRNLWNWSVSSSLAPPPTSLSCTSEMQWRVTLLHYLDWVKWSNEGGVGQPYLPTHHGATCC